MDLKLTRDRIHPFLYRTGLLMLACAMPLARVFVSIGQGLLVANWLAEGDFRRKAGRLKAQPAVVIFASVALLYVTGLVHSANTPEAIVRAWNILSVLILPIVIGSSPRLSCKFVRILLIAFAAAVTLASAISLIKLAMAHDPAVSGFTRSILFMSPIRFSLLVNLAIFILYGLAFRDPQGSLSAGKRDAQGSDTSTQPDAQGSDTSTQRDAQGSDTSAGHDARGFVSAAAHHPTGSASTGERFLYLFFMIALAAYLFVLRSMTGLVTFCILVLWTVFTEIRRAGNRNVRTLAWLVAAAGMLAIIIYPATVYRSNFHGREVVLQEMDSITVNGNAYMHDTVPAVLENGHYIDLYVCEKELRQAWNHASTLPFDGTDRKGQQLSSTLRRYMTSKGLRKDSLGFRALSATDIANVENGMTNYRFRDASPLFQRLYGTLWEVHVYLRTGYVQDHSFSQRIVFDRLALKLIGEHPLFGTGPGDVQDAMLRQAEKDHALVEATWKGRPHNQFLFLILAFGLTGFAWTLFAWIYPLVSARKKAAVTRDFNQVPFRHALPVYLRDVFLIILFLSMLVMDTLESYDSVVFFSLFYSLFVLLPEANGPPGPITP